MRWASMSTSAAMSRSSGPAALPRQARLRQAREQITEACRHLRADGLVVGTAGNLSIRVDDLVAITPSGLDYALMRPDLVSVISTDGTVVDGPLKPASEWELHLRALQATGDAAVVHTHSPAATAVASLQGVTELPAVHYYLAMFGGTVRVAPYARFGTPELARHVEEALRDRTGALMGNHGAVVTAPDLETAYEKALQLEWVCDVYLRTLASGSPRILDDAEISGVIEAIATYGQRPPESADEATGADDIG